MKKKFLLFLMFLLILTIIYAGTTQYELVESQELTDTYGWTFYPDDQYYQTFTTPRDILISRWNMTFDRFEVATPEGTCWLELWSADGTTTKYGTSTNNYTCGDFSEGVTYNFDFNDISLTGSTQYRIRFFTDSTEGRAQFKSSSLNPYDGGTLNGGTEDIVFWYFEDNRTTIPTISNVYDVTGAGTNKTSDTTPTINLTTDVSATCNISTDNSTWFGFTTTGDTKHQGTVDASDPLEIGYPQNVTVNCTGEGGSSYATIVYNITDAQPPQVVLNQPANNSVFEYLINNTITLNFTATDNYFSTLECNLTINGALNQTNKSVSSGVKTSWNTSIFGIGDYIWNVSCIDEHRNSNSSQWRFIVNATVKPTITFISQSPSDLVENSSGRLIIKYTMTSPYPINLSTILLQRTLFDVVNDNYYWPFRVPSNSKAVQFPDYSNGNILRADNRNESKWWESKYDDIYTWAVVDKDNVRFTVKPNADNTSVNITYNGSIQNSAFRNVWYLDRTELEGESKNFFSIYEDNPIIIKAWNGESILGIKNYTLHLFSYLNQTDLPKDDLNLRFCDKDFNLTAGISPTDSGNCSFVTSFLVSDVNDYIYTAINSSYVETIIGINNSKFGNLIINDTFYIVFDSLTKIQRPYTIAFANGSTSTNISFKDTKVAWSSNDAGVTWNQENLTFDIWISTAHAGDQFKYQLRVSDVYNNENRTNNQTDVIGSAFFPPTRPDIEWIDGYDIYLNGTHKDLIDIKVLFSTDPDSPTIPVKHNLSLLNPDGSLNYTINGSFNTSDGSINITFDTSLVSDGKYRLSVNVTDNDNQKNSFISLNNFTIDNTYPIYYNNQSNDTSPKINDYVALNITVNDTNPAQVWSSNNFTGTWINETPFDYISGIGVSNITQVTKSEGHIICYIWYFNDSVNHLNQSTISCMTVENTDITLKTDLTFKNCSAYHCFNSTAEFTDADGYADIDSITIESSSGTCLNLINTSSGTDVSITFNCTGTALTETTIRINASDGSSTINSSQKTNTYPNNPPPQVTDWITPSKAITYSNTNLNFNWTDVIDLDDDTVNYHFFTNISLGELELVYNDTISNRTSNYTVDANYTYIVGTYDGYVNGSNSTARKFVYDTTIPQIEYSGGTPNNDSDTYDGIYVNVSITEINFNNITFYLFDSDKNSVNTTNYTTEIFNINFSVSSDGLYYYNVTVRDKAGNENSTETRQITVNTSLSILINLNDIINKDRKYEFGSIANITATLVNILNETYPSLIFVDFDASNYGVNYTNGTGNVSFLYNISLLRQDEFISGSVGTWTQDEFSDGNTTKNLTFNPKESKYENISIPNDANITSATLNLEGIESNLKLIGNLVQNKLNGITRAYNTSNRVLSMGVSGTLYLQTSEGSSICSSPLGGNIAESVTRGLTMTDSNILWVLNSTYGTATFRGVNRCIGEINCTDNKTSCTSSLGGCINYTCEQIFTIPDSDISGSTDTLVGITTQDGNYLYVAAYNNKSILKYNTSGSLKSKINLSFTPSGIYYDGSFFYIGVYSVLKLVKLDIDGNNIKNYTIPSTVCNNGNVRSFLYGLYIRQDFDYDYLYTGIYDDGLASCYYNFPKYPSNLTIKNENILVYENLSKINFTETIDLNKTTIQNAVDTCSKPEGDNCLFELNFTLGTNNTIELSDLSISYTQNSTVQFSMDSRTDLLRGNVSVIGTDNPWNITISTYGSVAAILPGYLNNTNLTHKTFIYNGKEYDNFNVTYLSAETNTIFLNISGSGNTFYNITFQLYGFEVDKENKADYQDNFTNESIYLINLNSSVYGFYDNMENKNIDGWWEFTSIDSPEYDCNITNGSVDDYLSHLLPTGQYSYGSSTCTSTNDGDDNFDLKNTSSHFIRGQYNRRAERYSDFASCSSAGSVYITDGTNVVTVKQLWSGSSLSDFSYYFNITLNKKTRDSWDYIYQKQYFEKETGTIDLSNLDENYPWYYKFYIGQSAGTVGRDCVMNNYINIYDIKRSALSLNRTYTNRSYKGNTSYIISDIIVNTSITHNYTAAWLFADEYLPSNTNVVYYLSADNGSNWQGITKTERNIFNTQGNQIRFKANLTTGNLNYSPIIYNIRVRVIPARISNIEIDAGDDGDNDWNRSGELNSTTSPWNVSINYNELFEYADDYDSNDVFLFPISISSGSEGVLQVKNIESKQNPNPIVLNTTSLENCETCKISVNFAGGLINFTSLMVDFLGSENYTVFAHTADHSVNHSQKLLVKYSKFNCTFIRGIDYFEPFPIMSRNDKNVTPYGQEINYCNTSSDIYCENSSIPIFNCTYYGYDEDLANVSIILNDTQGGIDIWFDDGINKSDGINLTTDEQFIIQLNKTHSRGIWSWVDFWNTSLENIYRFDPNMTFESYCSECFH